MPHRTAGCGKSSLRPLMAGSSPSLPDGSNPSAAIVQSASDVQCSRLLKMTQKLSFSEDGCTRQRGLKAVVQSSIERTVSGVRCTNDDLKPVLVALATDQPLDVRYRDHDLSGDWAGYRECHIKPDLLLIYRKSDADTLRLARLGSHSELFG